MRTDPSSPHCPVCRREFPAGVVLCPDDQSPLVQPGTAVGQLVGRYRILQPLGRGQAGTIYRANQVDLDRVVAVKIIAGPSEEQARRFMQEARAVAGLHHAHVVHVFEVGRTTTGDLFMAMELLDGVALDRVLASEAPLEQRRAVRIAAQVADGLAAAHAHGIVHRDLKPANLFVLRSAAGEAVKIVDFGLAKLLDARDHEGARRGPPGGRSGDDDDSSITAAGALVGSPWYMSPEQCRDEEIDGRADLYALGAVLYEMLTGAPPFVAPTVVRILSMHLAERPVPPLARNHSLHAGVNALVLQLLEKDRARRPAGAEQVALALMRLDRELGEADELTFPNPPLQHGTAVARPEPPPGKRTRGPTKEMDLPRDGDRNHGPRIVAFKRVDTDVDSESELSGPEGGRTESAALAPTELAAVELDGADDDSAEAVHDTGQHTVVDAPPGARGPIPEEGDWDSAVLPETPTDATQLERDVMLHPAPPAGHGDATRPVPVPRSRSLTVTLDEADIEIIDLDAAVDAAGGDRNRRGGGKT